MSPTAERYRQLTRRLLEARAWHHWSEEQETSLLDEMDSVWWQLTQDERAEADQWLADLRAASAAREPEEYQDVEVSENEPERFPRERSTRAA